MCREWWVSPMTCTYRHSCLCSSFLPARFSPLRELPSPGCQQHFEGGLLKGGLRAGMVGAFCSSTQRDQALPSTNTASFGTPREEYGLVSGWWLGLQTFVHDIWRPATNAPRTMATRTGWRALLFTLTLSKTRLSRAVQPAYLSDTVAVVCLLYMPLSAFRVPAPYFPLAVVNIAGSHRSNICFGKAHW